MTKHLHDKPAVIDELLELLKELEASSIDEHQVTGSLSDLSENDRLVVYHGTSISEVPKLINGFDATRIRHRLYGGPKHRGLFVTPDFKTAERFASYGEVVLELVVRAKNLHGTDYSGRTGRQQKQEKKTEEWLASKFPNSFRPYLSLTLTQSAEPQALLIGLVSPKQILRVWHKAKRSDAGKWYTRSEFLALGLEAGPSAEDAQGIKKKVEELGIDLSSPRLSLDEFLDAAAKLADVPRSRVESSFAMRANRGVDELVSKIESLGFQPTAARAFARKFMKSTATKTSAGYLCASAATAIKAASSLLTASASRSRLTSLRGQLAKRAQVIYNDWNVDNDTYGDWKVGFGGICHLIADELADEVSDKTKFPAVTVSSYNEVHVYVVVQTPDGVYSVDIRPHVYETGGGYAWKKIPNVEFDVSDVEIDLLSPNPRDMGDFVEEWDDEDGLKLDDEDDIDASTLSARKLPRKYTSGLGKRKSAERKAEILKRSKLPSSDPKAYREFSTDYDRRSGKRLKTRKSKHTLAYEKKFGKAKAALEVMAKAKAKSKPKTVKGLAKKAKESGISLGILRQVYNRGLAAWRTGHRPGAPQHAWGMGRVNSFITKGKTWKTTDADLAKKVRQSKRTK